MLSTPSGNASVVKELQAVKAPLPILVTLDGIVSSVKELQPRNA